MLELAFQPDRRAREPLYSQLADHLRDLIAAGRLPTGEKLPPSRELARALGLSRNTVSRAYDALSTLGLLAAEVGRGTYIAGALAPASRKVAPTRARLAWSGLLATRARRLRDPGVGPEPDPASLRFDFRRGRVATSELPVAELQSAYQRALGRVRNYANDFHPLGWPPLREAIARLLVARGINCSPSHVLVVNGAQQALDLVARVLVSPRDAVALEQPGYFGATFAFRGAEADLIGIGVDGEGLRVDELARILRTRRVKLVYTTPASQCPTGVVLAPERREALLALAEREQLPVVEDDYDCELRHADRTAPALKCHDPGELVIYVGTFSKALFPGLRLGYLLAPGPLRAPLGLMRAAASFQPPLVDQIALAEFLSGDGFERHVRRVRRRYAEGLAAMKEALRAAMPPAASFRDPAGGNCIWLTLPRDSDASAIQERAARRGIAVATSAAFYAEPPAPPALKLCFATESPDAIRTGIAQLGECVGEALGASS